MLREILHQMQLNGEDKGAIEPLPLKPIAPVESTKKFGLSHAEVEQNKVPDHVSDPSASTFTKKAEVAASDIRTSPESSEMTVGLKAKAEYNRTDGDVKFNAKANAEIYPEKAPTINIANTTEGITKAKDVNMNRVTDNLGQAQQTSGKFGAEVSAEFTDRVKQNSHDRTITAGKVTAQYENMGGINEKGNYNATASQTHVTGNTTQSISGNINLQTTNLSTPDIETARISQKNIGGGAAYQTTETNANIRTENTYSAGISNTNTTTIKETGFTENSVTNSAGIGFTNKHINTTTNKTESEISTNIGYAHTTTKNSNGHTIDTNTASLNLATNTIVADNITMGKKKFLHDGEFSVKTQAGFTNTQSHTTGPNNYETHDYSTTTTLGVGAEFKGKLNDIHVLNLDLKNISFGLQGGVVADMNPCNTTFKPSVTGTVAVALDTKKKQTAPTL